MPASLASLDISAVDPRRVSTRRSAITASIHTMDTTRSTRVRQHIRAPRAAVYRLLLDPTAVAQWKVPEGMTAHVHAFEPTEGGAIRVSLTYREPSRAGKSIAHTDTYAGRFIR